MKTSDLRTAKLIRTQIRNLQPSIYDQPATELSGLFNSPCQCSELSVAREKMARPKPTQP